MTTPIHYDISYQRLTGEQVLDLWRIGALSHAEAVAGLREIRRVSFNHERVDALMRDLEQEIHDRLDGTGPALAAAD